MYGTKSLFALVLNIAASLLFLLSIAAAFDPSRPQSANWIFMPLVGLILAMYALSWRLIRLARIEMGFANPHHWRFSDFLLAGQLGFSGWYFSEVFGILNALFSAG
jgi:hypothetical protein